MRKPVSLLRVVRISYKQRPFAEYRMMKACFLFAAVLILFASVAEAISPKRGKERLRELAVFPTIELNFSIGFDSDFTAPSENTLPETISKLRDELKSQPNDSERQIKLGRLLEQHGETNAARACFAEALKIARRNVELQPLNGYRFTQLGEALRSVNQHQASENAFRNGVLLSSNEWKCWTGLGGFLDSRAFFLLTGQEMKAAGFAALDSLDSDILDVLPASEAIHRAEEISREATECFDRAVALAPDDARVYLVRSLHHWRSHFTQVLLRHFRSEEIVTERVMAENFFPASALEDVRHAMRLDSKNYQTVALAAWLEWMTSVARLGTSSEKSFDALPDDTQQFIREALRHLEHIGQFSDKTAAAGALGALGVMKTFVIGNPQAGLPDLRAAVSLNPGNDQLWEMLMGALVESASPADVVEFCRSRIKRKDSARNHLLLAKALTKQDKWRESTQEAKSVLKHDPENISAHLMLAALALRQSSDETLLPEAIRNLGRVAMLLNKIPDSHPAKAGWQREWVLNTAIYRVLNDEPEKAKAALDRLLKDSPNDAQAKEILSAME